MGYIIRRLLKLKKAKDPDKKYRVIKQEAGKEDEVKAKRTTLKKALFQRAILQTIDQLAPHLYHDEKGYTNKRMNKYLEKIQDPNYRERKPNKKKPHEVDRIVPPPREIAKADYEEEEQPKIEDKPKDKPPEEPPKEYELPPQSRIDAIIELIKEAKIRSEGTSKEKEIEALKNLTPLSNQEKKWMATAAMAILSYKKDPTGKYELSATQRARYSAWEIRLRHNKQEPPSIVKELDKYNDKHGDTIS